MAKETNPQWTLPAGNATRDYEKLSTEEGGQACLWDDNTPTDGTVEMSVVEEVTKDTRTSMGFRVTLEKLRYVATKPEIVEKELMWQVRGRGENTQAQAKFKEEILAQRPIRAFAIMCENSPFLTISHSIRKFFADPGDENKGLHRKVIAFVGD